MDNLNISHFDRNLVTNTITWPELIYGKIHGSQVKKHNNLGIWLYFSSKGEVKVSMEESLKKLIDRLSEDIKGTASTNAVENLFKVQDYDTRNMLHGT